MSTSRRALSLARGALGLAALLGAGCKNLGATGGCPVTGDCGGDPSGVWQVDPAPDLTCNFPVVSRPAQNYANTAPYFEPETGAMAPAVTSGNWCWDLTFNKDGTVSTPTVPLQNPDVIVGGTITFNNTSTDHSYTFSLTAVSTTRFHVAKSCFGVNGANLTCTTFAAALVNSSAGNNPVYMNASMGAVPAFRCQDGGDGCDCQFDYIETDQNAVGDTGTWTLDGNVIHQYSKAGQGNLNETSPSRRSVRDATFCVSEDKNTLQLTGTNGQALANKAGTRSLTLTRVQPDAGTSNVDAAAGQPDVGGSVKDAGGTPDAGAVDTAAPADADAG
ncbi:MAG TPA: hypothetical protein VH560_17275 [Polyangia bacterium]|jgi:hypothetical protein|nr:hypothetical protein [Polyangia bacterium]